MKLLSILTIALLVSQASLAQKKEKSFNFPPHLFEKETVLIIGEGMSKKVTKHMIEIIEEIYKGPYVEIGKMTHEQIIDQSKYRFVFFGDAIYNSGYTHNGERSPSSNDTRFGIRDLSTGKYYMSDHINWKYKDNLKRYVEALEQLRIERSGSK